MREIDPALKEDFERWTRKIGDDPFAAPGNLGYRDVLRAHYLLVDYFANEGGEGISLYGVKNENLLLSAMGRQLVEFEGRVKWKEPIHRCATLFFGLIKNHAFHDGNKRTAFLSALYHLQMIGRTLCTSHSEFESLAVITAAGTLEKYPRFKKFEKRGDPEVNFIADFFRKNTREVDKRQYAITFRDLDRILRKYGFLLSNPDGNYIDVVRNRTERFGFFKQKKRVVQEAVIKIGFPGWSRQVFDNALQKVRKATELTPENGVDSQVFYQEADALFTLIGEYHGPLLRLRDK